MQLALLLVIVGNVLGQQGRELQSVFEIRLPANVQSERVQIQYRLRGSFGGYHSFVRSEPNVHSYQITTEVGKRPAESLKAIIFVPGCQFATITAQSLAESTRTHQFECEPLASTTFVGKTELPESLRGREYEVEFTLQAEWAMEFFGYVDGSVPTFQVVRLDPYDDGSVRGEIPDFTRDAVVGSWSYDKTTFRIVAREKRTGNSLGRLEPVDAKYNQFGNLRLHTFYPGELILRVRR
jgi:hypothetical protein